ncbi:hypothetical protein Avbf_02521 [Armadillidium vulgare]|nr:hypothetical protein Avbf_02521 [Armadillidium vulgare]
MQNSSRSEKTHLKYDKLLHNFRSLIQKIIRKTKSPKCLGQKFEINYTYESPVNKFTSGRYNKYSLDSHYNLIKILRLSILAARTLSVMCTQYFFKIKLVNWVSSWSPSGKGKMVGIKIIDVSNMDIVLYDDQLYLIYVREETKRNLQNKVEDLEEESRNDKLLLSFPKN